MKKSLLLLLVFIGSKAILAQNTGDAAKNYLPLIVGFYNLENLFDTVDNKEIDDQEFLPSSAKKYNTERYFEKVNHMADIIFQIGTQYNKDGLALMGCVEVENDTVLTDLILSEKLMPRGYQFVHFNSPDARGIDVALIYNPAYFAVLQKKAVQVALPDHYPTRNILWVKGLLAGDTINVLVNHWPSRRGGGAYNDIMARESDRRGDMGRRRESNSNLNTIFQQNAGNRNEPLHGGDELSEPNRLVAAAACRAIINELLGQNPNARIITMGDFNDDPSNKSISTVLQAGADINNLSSGMLYNPFADMHKKGFGTLAYGGKWNLFDQIMFSQALVNQTLPLFLYKAHIYLNDLLLEKSGEYKGYPKRSWVGDSWHNGYSDHLPVYTVLAKQLDE